MKMWLAWALASAVGFGFGGRLGRVLSPSDDVIVVGFVALSFSLVVAGALQWLILRPMVAASGWWVPASIGGVAIFGVLVYGTGLVDRDVGWVLAVIAGWTALGVLQWLVLREDVAGAGWWMLAHVGALVVAGPGVGFVTWLTGAPVETALGNALRWLTFGSAYGIVTGAVLLWLLRERIAVAAI